jgi:hypothetical protein
MVKIITAAKYFFLKALGEYKCLNRSRDRTVFAALCEVKIWFLLKMKKEKKTKRTKIGAKKNGNYASC